MHWTKLDDYQSWLLTSGEERVLIDPWLTPVLRFPLGTFRRDRAGDVVHPLHPTALIITAPFGDHLDAQSLDAYDRALPVFTNAPAARRLRAQGFSNVRVVRADEQETFGAMRVRFVAPGFPYSHNSLGLFVEDEGGRAYLETHVVGKASLASLPKPIDLLITTMESVRLFGIQLAMDAERAAMVAAALEAKTFVPTGIDPGRSTGMLSALLWVNSDQRAFTDALARLSPTTRFAPLASGESLATSA
jgi:L-ascorbate metabolism protein UlaG (beta-lactamase superfamily)